MEPLMLIDGATVRSDSATDVINPATGLVIGSAPECSDAQLSESVQAATRAFDAWRDDVEFRRATLHAAGDAVEPHIEEIAALVTAEQGKPLALATMEAQGTAAMFQMAAEVELPRELIRDDEDARLEVVGRAIGVVAAITSWNFPVLMAANKLGPALVTGNTVVLKPSPFTPLTTLRLGEILREVFPPGVVNIISGGSDVGAQLVGSDGVRKISFTGSIPTGKTIARQASADMKRVTLELGGNDAAILLDDFDVDTMADALLWGALRNSGQVCAAVKRVYAPADRYDEIVAALAERADAVRVGAGNEPGIELGPLQNLRQLERVAGLVTDAVARGARCVTGGERIDRDGFFYPPTIVAGAVDGMPLVDEEQFGPVIPVIAYDELDDAIRAANGTRFGLGGSVWGLDDERAASIGARLTCGTAWINTHAVPLADAPYGGRDWSGIGVENGRWGLEAFVDWQTLYTARPRVSPAALALSPI